MTDESIFSEYLHITLLQLIQMLTHVFHWPNAFVNVFLTNHQVNIENDRCIEKSRTKLDEIKQIKRDVISVYAKDSARDIETQIYLWIYLITKFIKLVVSQVN